MGVPEGESQCGPHAADGWSFPARQVAVLAMLPPEALPVASKPVLCLPPVLPACPTGNTVVLKPASSTRLTALLLAELCAQAGLPPGVVNVVTGDQGLGEALAAHPGLDQVAFAGSAEVKDPPGGDPRGGGL